MIATQYENHYIEWSSYVTANVETLHQLPNYTEIISYGADFYCHPSFCYYWKWYFDQALATGNSSKQGALLWIIKIANDRIFYERRLALNGQIRSLDSWIFLCKASILRAKDLNVKENPPAIGSFTQSSVNYELDYFDMAKYFIDKGGKVAVLALAGMARAGANYEFGGNSSQEEDMYRRSFLSCHLNCEWTKDPLKEDFGFFSKDVIFFRSSAKEGFGILDKAYQINVITVPFPDLNQIELNKAQYEVLLRKKLDLTFQIAIKMEITHLILGSLGFKSHKTQLKIFKNILKEKVQEFAGYLNFVLVSIGGTYEGEKGPEELDEIFSGLGDKKKTQIFNPNFESKEISSHSGWFSKDQCVYKGSCTGAFTENHFTEKTHPPVCENSENCQNDSKDHISEYWHNPSLTPCPYGFACILKLPKKMRANHCKLFTHPFLPICQKEPHCEKKDIEDHKNKFSHFCAYSKECKDLGKKLPSHCKFWVHVDQEKCAKGNDCLNKNPYHYIEYMHPNIKPTSKPCPAKDSCQNRDHKHRIIYLHDPDPPEICEFSGLNIGCDFGDNIKKRRMVLKKYIADNKLEDLVKKAEVLNFIKSLQPQHRCKIDIFKKVIAHAGLMSRYKLVHFSNNQRENIISQIGANPIINDILISRNQKGGNKIMKWLESFVDGSLIGDGLEKGAWASQKEDVKLNFNKIVGEDNIKKIKAEILNIIDISKKVQPMGIGYDVDTELGTDKFVFCTIGPNRGFHYGEIIIFLSPEIMYHPDFNMTPVAGTSFMNKADTPGITNNFKFRPWSKNECPPDLQNSAYSRPLLKNLFNISKINAAIPGWVEYFSEELVAKSDNNKKKSNPVEFHNYVDSHFTFEGHMPDMISFAYIEKIAMPEDIYNNQLTDFDKERLLKLLKGGKENLMLFKCHPDKIIEEVYKNYNFIKEIRHDSSKGFSFTIEKKYGDTFAMPITLDPISSPNNFLINFNAQGWDIHLSFSKTTTNTKNNNNKNQFLQLIINNCYSYRSKGNFNNAAITLAATNTVERFKFAKQAFIGTKNFESVSSDEICEYTIILNYNANGLTVSLKRGLASAFFISSQFNPKIDFFIDKNSENFIPIGELKYLHFSCWERPIKIDNLCVL